MRFSAFLPAAAAVFLGWGVFQARANDLEPKNIPNQNQIGTAQATATIIVTGQAQAVPVQGAPTVVNGAVAGGRATGGFMSIDANGTRQMENEEYGQKLKMIDDPAQGIKIEQTVHKGGTDETKSYEAKDAKELEKKSPEAFKLYQKYLGNQPQVIQAGAAAMPAFVPGQLQIMPGGPIQLQMVPGQGPVPFPMPGGGAIVPQGGTIVFQGQAALAPGGMPIEAATQMMTDLGNQLSAATKNSTWEEASAESKTALKKQAEELKKQLGELEKTMK